MYNNNTTTFADSFNNCSDEEMKFYISLLCNVGLSLITIISEGMGASKCKSNGLIHSISKTLSKTSDELTENNRV